jgi:hypothetical protein
MTPEGWAALADLANSITVLGLGAIIIVALVRRIVVTAATHAEIVGLKNEQIAEIARQRDEAIAGWKAQTDATATLTGAVVALKSVVERQADRRREYDAPGARLDRGSKE